MHRFLLWAHKQSWWNSFFLALFGKIFSLFGFCETVISFCPFLPRQSRAASWLYGPWNSQKETSESCIQLVYILFVTEHHGTFHILLWQIIHDKIQIPWTFISGFTWNEGPRKSVLIYQLLLFHSFSFWKNLQTIFEYTSAPFIFFLKKNSNNFWIYILEQRRNTWIQFEPSCFWKSHEHHNLCCTNVWQKSLKWTE